MKTLIDIEDKIRTEFKVICAEKNKSMKEVIEELIRAFILKEKSRNKVK